MGQQQTYSRMSMDLISPLLWSDEPDLIFAQPDQMSLSSLGLQKSKDFGSKARIKEAAISLSIKLESNTVRAVKFGQNLNFSYCNKD